MKSDSNDLGQPVSNKPSVSPYLKAFSSAMARRRKSYKLSQRRLAELAGTTQKTVSQIEAGVGNHSIGTLNRIAGAMGGEVRLTLGNRPTASGRKSRA